MHDYADPTQKSKQVTNRTTPRGNQLAENAAGDYEDHRPETTVQRQLNDVIQRAVIVEGEIPGQTEDSIYKSLEEIPEAQRKLFPTDKYSPEIINACIARFDLIITNDTRSEDIEAWLDSRSAQIARSQVPQAERAEVGSLQKQLAEEADKADKREEEIIEVITSHKEVNTELVARLERERSIRTLGKVRVTGDAFWNTVLMAAAVAAPFLTPAVPVWWVLVGAGLYFLSKIFLFLVSRSSAETLMIDDKEKGSKAKEENVKKFAREVYTGIGGTLTGIVGSEVASHMSSALLGWLSGFAAVAFLLVILSVWGDDILEYLTEDKEDSDKEEKKGAPKKAIKSSQVMPESGISRRYASMEEMPAGTAKLFASKKYSQEVVARCIAHFGFEASSRTTAEEVEEWLDERVAILARSHIPQASRGEVASHQKSLAEQADKADKNEEEIIEVIRSHKEVNTELVARLERERSIRTLGKVRVTGEAFWNTALMAAAVAAPFLTPAVPVWWVLVGAGLYFLSKIFLFLVSRSSAETLMIDDKEKGSKAKEENVKKFAREVYTGIGGTITGIVGSEVASHMNSALLGWLSGFAALAFLLVILSVWGDDILEYLTDDKEDSEKEPKKNSSTKAITGGDMERDVEAQLPQKEKNKGSGGSAIVHPLAPEGTIESRTTGGWLNNGDIVRLATGERFRVSEQGTRGNNCLLLCILARMDMTTAERDEVMRNVRRQSRVGETAYLGVEQIAGWLEQQGINARQFVRVGNFVRRAGETNGNRHTVHIINVGGNHWQLMEQID